MNSTKPIFAASNRHTASCGTPPAWLAEPQKGLRSYFENAHGEQWIAEATKDRLLLTGGDVGWETYSIQHPNYGELAAQLAAGSSPTWSGGEATVLVLEQAERTWLLPVCLARSGI